jgi:sugar O-acyltransferase (sialic acid O-acetyltransferase NeuD family)
MQPSDLTIIGCGGHARSVADIALASGWTRVVFVDPNAGADESIYGFPVVTLDEARARGVRIERYIVALGDNAARAAAAEQFRALTGRGPESVIAASAYVGREAQAGTGLFVGAGAHIGPATRIGDNVIVNTRAIVEHETVVGAHTHVAVGAILLGRVTIGERVLVGAGAVVRDGVRVASDVSIGAGAVVTGDIGAAGSYAGVPARRL